MLSDKYRNALNGLKAQGKASHLFEGCEAETQQINRILMTESVSVNELDEAKLAAFLAKETSGKAVCHMLFERPNTAFYPFSPDAEQVGSFVNELVLKRDGNGYSMLKLNQFGNKD